MTYEVIREECTLQESRDEEANRRSRDFEGKDSG